MGLIRKSMSVSTLGLIDFRSDKERIARSTRRTDKAVRAQTKAQAEQHAAQMQAMAAQAQAQLAATYQLQNQAAQQAQLAALQQGQVALPPQQAPAAGWYPDPQDNAGLMRWFDGSGWTEHTQPRP
ncbi:DUF2510 domain-containing protein [Blastococcus sp. SYSU D00669]